MFSALIAHRRPTSRSAGSRTPREHVRTPGRAGVWGFFIPRLRARAESRRRRASRNVSRWLSSEAHPVRTPRPRADLVSGAPDRLGSLDREPPERDPPGGGSGGCGTRGSQPVAGRRRAGRDREELAVPAGVRAGRGVHRRADPRSRDEAHLGYGGLFDVLSPLLVGRLDRLLAARGDALRGALRIADGAGRRIRSRSPSRAWTCWRWRRRRRRCWSSSMTRRGWTRPASRRCGSRPGGWMPIASASVCRTQRTGGAAARRRARVADGRRPGHRGGRGPRRRVRGAPGRGVGGSRSSPWRAAGIHCGCARRRASSLRSSGRARAADGPLPRADERAGGVRAARAGLSPRPRMPSLC